MHQTQSGQAIATGLPCYMSVTHSACQHGVAAEATEDLKIALLRKVQWL